MASPGVDEPIADTDSIGFGPLDLVSRQDELLRSGFANQLAQTVGAARAGDDTQSDFWQANSGRVGEDAETGGEGELEATAQGQRGHHGDGRYLKAANIGKG